jgi:hypothetical protein
MNKLHDQLQTIDSVGIRAVIAAIDRQLSGLPPDMTNDLRRCWAELVDLLAIAPAPQLRRCPVCNHVGMRAATCCGYCWTKLSPSPSVADDAVGAPPN